METSTSANGKTTIIMDKELIHLLMETNDQGCGSMVNSEVLVLKGYKTKVSTNTSTMTVL
jgi:hypothetical protein